ncbi:MAG: hypothetical protein GY788_04395 [bacterium]|nr:hypothetical protein [bacterium]
MASDTAPAVNSRIVGAQIGLIALGAFSALILASFGGQLIFAPALLPAQWHIARTTSGMTSMVFSTLGAALSAEVSWIGLGLLASWSGSAVAGGLVVIVGVVVGIFFFRTSRPTNKD